MQYVLEGEETGDPETPLLTVPEFRQRLLRFESGSGERQDEERDEVLYVLEGSAVATVGGERQELEPGAGVFVACGTPWRMESANDLKLISVLVEKPLPASASHAVIPSGERGPATAGREFTLLAHPENGCASVTQFVGYIPPGRAPDHFHRYDEVVYVLAGDGAVHVDGESAPLRAGSCVHLPARLVHCLANTGDTELRLPDGRWVDQVSGRDHSGTVPVADLLAERPVVLLAREEAS